MRATNTMSNVEKKIYQILKKYVDKSVVLEPNTPMEELNIDSFQFIQISVEIEEVLKIKIDDEMLDMSEFHKLGDFTGMLEGLM